jgi:2-polyprenyl-3-methyl-5-hydroxy-6-metoxy-1,4-benzoquinol methylase
MEPSVQPKRADSHCRICSASTSLSYLLYSRRIDLTVQLFYCADCDAYFTGGGKINYDDSDLIDYYLKYVEVIRSRHHRNFAFIESLVVPGRFLDIGAGMGYSLEVAEQRGWVAKGLEPNEKLVNHAKSRELDITKAYLGPETSGEYDFILIDNVLEHILQPAEFLGHALRLLAPKGIMMVAVPPMDWLRKQLGAIAYVRDHVMVPQLNIFYESDEHVNMFSRKAMGRLLHRVGLRLLDVRFHHSLAYNNPLFRGLRLDDGYYFAVRA